MKRSIVMMTMILTPVAHNGCGAGGGPTAMNVPTAEENEVLHWLQEIDFRDPDHVHGVDALSSQPSYEEWLNKGRRIPHVGVILTKLLAAKDAASKVNRSQVAYAIGWVGDVQSVPALIDAVREKDVLLRIESAAALGRLKDTAAIDALCTVLAADPASNVRANAAVALGSFSGEKVRTSLELALRDESQFVREMAKTSIDSIGR